MSLLLVLLSLSTVAASRMKYELLPYEPLANASAMIVSGSARFSVLTEHVIRLEYSVNGKFEDRATVAFVNRRLPVPAFSVRHSATTLHISTKSIAVEYVIGTNFSSTTLKVSSLTGAFADWHFGDAQSSGNLLGTIRSLDDLGAVPLDCNYWKGMQQHDESLHCEPALISRDGWAFVNDSGNWGLDQNDWWQTPNTDQVDLYFFGHGLNYKQALYDYSLLGGKTAMVPRYASGISWSRWYDIDNRNVEAIVRAYSDWQMPLDTFILDMDWHTKDGWGGYTFDRRLFPEPSEALADYLKAELNLAVSVNLHDDDGVRPTEAMYVPMCAAMGVNPASQQTIPFQITNRTYAIALEDIVLADVERQGVDFMWIDWQQGGSLGGCAGGKQNPTIWLQKLRATNPIRRGQSQRGIVLSRFGGLGAHRYQVGFSGDVADVDWDNLAYQPYFSYTAANVLYGYWSHDIVGAGSHDHELHTRWIQWGSVSGHFRTHDRGMSAGGCANDVPEDCGHVAPWAVPPANVFANRLAMQRREALVPYIYNAARAAFETGIGLIYPMYYEWPQCNQSYAGTPTGAFAQYYFGADIISAPVVKAADPATGLSEKQIWVPPGAWYDVVAGLLVQSPQPCGVVITRHYTLEDQPMFVRAGAIVPRRLLSRDLISQARRPYDEIEFTVYPGDCGSTSLYEDDAETMSYLTAYSRQTVRCTQRSVSQVAISIDAAQSTGGFQPPQSRHVVVRFPMSAVAVQVLIDGKVMPWSRFANGPSWHYDGRDTSVVVDCGVLTTNTAHVVAVVFAKLSQPTLLDGLSGIMSRAETAKSALDEARETPGSEGTHSEMLLRLASAAAHLSARMWNATAFQAEVAFVRSLVPQAVTELKQHIPPPQDALVQMYSVSRGDNVLCANSACLGSNDASDGYVRMRVEGFQPSSGSMTKKLKAWWNPSIPDNFETDPSYNLPSGYSRAVFSGGLALKTQVPGTIPLRVFWNGRDFLTVASAGGIAWAQQHNYTDMQHVCGYVYAQPWRNATTVDDVRWAYAIGLVSSF